MQSGRWTQPDDELIRRLVPCLHEPIDLLLGENQMRFESQLHPAWKDDPFFREFFGSEHGDRPLPWLDREQALFVAVNRNLGDDIGIALDYRTNSLDPRVVASNWHSKKRGCCWEQVAPRFSLFVAMLGL